MILHTIQTQIPYPPSETRQDLQQLSTTQSNHISLSDVDPVDVQVRDLTVDVDLGASPLSLASLFTRKSNRDGSARPEKEADIAFSICFYARRYTYGNYWGKWKWEDDNVKHNGGAHDEWTAFVWRKYYVQWDGRREQYSERICDAARCSTAHSDCSGDCTYTRAQNRLFEPVSRAVAFETCLGMKACQSKLLLTLPFSYGILRTYDCRHQLPKSRE